MGISARKTKNETAKSSMKNSQALNGIKRLNNYKQEINQKILSKEVILKRYQDKIK